MKITPKERAAQLQFRAAISAAITERFEQHGRYSAEEILEDVIAATDSGWGAMRDHFAQRAALGVISAQMRREPRTVDDAQLKLWPELPVSRISYKHSIVASPRATIEEFLWYERWYENWCNGRVKRSEEDTKTLARLQRFGNLLRKHGGNDTGREIGAVMDERNARLDELRKVRKKRRRTSPI